MYILQTERAVSTNFNNIKFSIINTIHENIAKPLFKYFKLSSVFIITINICWIIYLDKGGEYEDVTGGVL